MHSRRRSADPTAERDGFSRADVGRIVLAYAAFGALWILLSDQALELAFSGTPFLIVAGMVKGWLFVAVTSALLWHLILRLDRRGGAGIPPAKLPARPLVLPLFLMAAFIAALTAAGMAYVITHQKEERMLQLQSVARLKAAQLSAWVGERKEDAAFMTSSQFLSRLYHAWRSEGKADSHRQLLTRLERFQRGATYRSVVLLDGDGAPLWHSGPGPEPVSAGLQAAARAAREKSETILLGPYRDAADAVRLDYVVPLPAARGRPAPVVILRIDPAAALNDMLQFWPQPTDTGESLLFRRDGEAVLFLNELRHRPDAAAKLRVSLSEQRLLAAQILNAEAKPGTVVEGIDYRQVPVVGVVQAIAGTDWHLVAKMDLEEAIAEGRRDAGAVALAGALALFLAVTAVMLLHKRQELILEQRRRADSEEKLRTLQLLDTVAQGSTDAIFAKDADGRYLLFNRAAEQVAGRAAAEVIGRKDIDIFPATQADQMRSDDRRVMAENRVGTIEETVGPAGGEVTLLTLKWPLHDAQGRVTGVFGISRDITARKAAETELRERNAELERFNRAVVGRELDMVALKRQVNELSRRLGEAAPFALAALDEAPPPASDGAAPR